MYSNFILNLCIVYELNTWPRNPTNNFTLKNCLFGTVKLTKNTGESKLIMVEEQHLMEKASGVLIMALLQML